MANGFQMILGRVTISKNLVRNLGQWGGDGEGGGSGKRKIGKKKCSFHDLSSKLIHPLLNYVTSGGSRTSLTRRQKPIIGREFYQKLHKNEKKLDREEPPWIRQWKLCSFVLCFTQEKDFL